jgi:O-antigen/teichoic acid export membrane protein
MKPLRHRTVAGLGWNAGTQALGKAFQFAVTIALARLLGPNEFGLVAMILVFTGLASSIADIGLGASIVQARTLSDENLDAAFWLNIAIGTTLTIILIVGAPSVSEFYGEPLLRPLTIALAFKFILDSTTVVQYALFQKNLDFRARFWIEIIAIPVAGIIAVAMALGGAGVWSLVGLYLCGDIVRTTTVWHLSSWRPRCRFRFAAVKGLLKFGQHLTGSNIVGYCAQNFHKLVIGRQIGSSALGIYNLSDHLMRVPLTNITGIAGAVMFPALSELQSNVDSAKSAYLRANRMIALVTFPMTLGLCALAEPAVLTIYGDKWNAAISIIQVLCLAGLAQSVYGTAPWIFLSRGRPDILFRLSVLSLLVRGAGVLIGMHWGLLGIAWAYVLGHYLCLLYPTWLLAGRLINVRFAELLDNVAEPFYVAVCMAVIIWLSDQWLFAHQPNWLRLVTQMSTGIVIYGLLIACFKLQAWQDVREMTLMIAGPRSRFIRFLLGNSS